jgi:hypothetical protein
MKQKQIMAFAVLALSALTTTQAATKVLYISGATAFRGVEFYVHLDRLLRPL